MSGDHYTRVCPAHDMELTWREHRGFEFALCPAGHGVRAWVVVDERGQVVASFDGEHGEVE